MKKIQVHVSVPSVPGDAGITRFPLIDAFDLGKGICLHRSLHEWREWSLTHISSGLKIVPGFRKKETAIEVAKKILLKLNWNLKRGIIIKSKKHKIAVQRVLEMHTRSK